MIWEEISKRKHELDDDDDDDGTLKYETVFCHGLIKF